jgi:diaminopimelate decarboxylase
MTDIPQSPEAVRAPTFVYRSVGKQTGRTLFCESLDLSKLAKEIGTPFYVYSAAMIRSRYQAFDTAFSQVPHLICYSVKANSSLSILRLLARERCGFDVVSGGELERVLHAERRSAKKVVFSGVGKTREELTAALKAGILLFNIESESELRVLGECARSLRKDARIAFRVNPDVAAETHPYISTGLHRHKFGVPIGVARALYAEAARSKHLRVAGVSVHIGSQITDVVPFGEAMERVADLVNQLRKDGHNIEYVDAGGGLGIPYQNDDSNEFADRLKGYAQALIKPLNELAVTLLLEPGRSIVGPAGALITSVIYKKPNNDKRFLIVDAAMNDLIRPALYNAHHQIIPVRIAAGAREIVDVVGPVCETGDFFARDCEIEAMNEGSLLAILDAGAYGMVLASNYNTRPRAPELLVSGKSKKLIRRRERISDLLRTEL